MKLIEKIILSGKIEVITGLHIGGSSSTMNIGETDLNVIKSPANGEPIIPGSTLKGKLRAILAKLEGSDNVDRDSNMIKTIFGYPKTKQKSGSNESREYLSRLIVRDSFLTNGDKLLQWEMENSYTEIKWENTINRISGSAKDPRQLERVPKGAEFHYEMVLDVYDKDKDKGYLNNVKNAMKLLEDDYIGGSGTRGYGKIKFHENEDEHRNIESYAAH